MVVGVSYYGHETQNISFACLAYQFPQVTNPHSDGRGSEPDVTFTFKKYWRLSGTLIKVISCCDLDTNQICRQ